jgi:uncharacterized RDD family membrane protein YckC
MTMHKSLHTLCFAVCLLTLAGTIRAQDEPQAPESNREVVAIMHDATVGEGEHARELVSVFGSVTNKGEIEDNAVTVFGDAQILGPVRGQVVSVFGSVYINSRVDGDVVAVLGDVQLGPMAEIHGQIVDIMGNLQRDPAAVVHGGIQRVFGGGAGGPYALRTWIRNCLLYARPLALAPGLAWAWGFALASLLFYAVIAALFPDGVRRCADTLDAHPGPAFLTALLVCLLTPVTIVLLAITVVGIPVIPLLGCALFCFGIFGRLVTLAWIGGRTVRAFNPASPVHPALHVLAGGLVVLLLYLIPVIGLFTYLLVGVLGFGAVCYTVLGTFRNSREHRTAAMAGGPAAPRGGPTGAASGPAPGSAPGPQPAESAESGAPGATSGAPGAASGASGAASGASGAATGASGAASTGPAAGTGPTVEAAAVAAIQTLPRAGFWIRIAALGLDALLVAIVLSILTQPHGDPPRFELLGLAAYGAAMWKWKNTTVGGIICDLKVVRLDGRPIDWGTAVVRALSCFLSLAVVGLGFLWIAFDQEHQAWHDKIAGTVVVRVPKGAPLL